MLDLCCCLYKLVGTLPAEVTVERGMKRTMGILKLVETFVY
jgi:hypothetical protein